MAGKIPDEILEAIRDRVSIVEVVSGHVTLKKAGRNYLGLCPFHAEKTPSFTVSDERGLFHCFGCGAGGTVFTFVMRADHLTFPEAVELLARRAGIALPQRSDSGLHNAARQEYLQVNELAQRHFRQALRSPAGAAARRYLEQRGLSPSVIERYGLGFAPPGGSGLTHSITSRQRAAELGLIGKRDDGSWYERFRGRITFPIRDGSGHIIGFGGRTLGSDHPKYLNSPESPLFHKGQVLYGLFEARQAIAEARRIVVVEGYLDTLALVQADIGFAVASLGTALSKDQLQRARRFAPDIIAFFDGDRAGQEAAARAFQVCVDAGVWGLGAFLPQGMDPDDYVRQHGAAATLALLQQAIPLADFFVQRLDPGPHASLPDKARAAERIGEVICRIEDVFQFNLLAKQTAERLGVDEVLFRELRSVRQAGGAPKAAAERPVAASFRPEELTLLEALALDQQVAALMKQHAILAVFSSPELADAGRALMAAWESRRSSQGAVDQLPAPLAERVTAALLGQGPLASADRVQVARDCIARIERRNQRERAREVLVTLRQAEAGGDDQRYREALAHRNALLPHKN